MKQQIKDLYKSLPLALLLGLAACNSGEEGGAPTGGGGPSGGGINYALELITTIDGLLFGPNSPAQVNVTGTCAPEAASIAIKNADTVVATVSCTVGAFNFDLETAWLNEGANAMTITIDEQEELVATIHLDTTAPGLIITGPIEINQSNQSAYTVFGTCDENGRPILGTLDMVPISTVCQSGEWSVSGIDVSFLPDNDYQLTVQMADALGNSTGDISATVTKNTSNSLPSLEFLNPSIGFGNQGSVTIRIGQTQTGHSLTLFDDPACSNQVVTDIASSSTHDFTLNTMAEGIYKYYLIEEGSSTTSCLGPLVYVEDQTVPPAMEMISMSSPLSGSNSNDSTPEFLGTIDPAEEGSVIDIYRDDACSDFVGSGSVSNGSFSVLGSLALDGSDNGTNEFFATVTDLAGNSSNCSSTSLSYNLGGAGLASLPKIAMVGNDSESRLVSLEDGNTITWIKKADPDNPIVFAPIDRGQVISIEDPVDSNDKVDQGDMILSTGASYVVTKGFGTAPWASEAYAGKIFSSYQHRFGKNSPRMYVAAVTADAFVQLKQDSDGDGVLDVISSAQIPKNSVHLFEEKLKDGRSFQIVSDQNINVYYVSSQNGSTYDRDARVLTPAATEIIGFSWFLTAIEANTNYSAYRNQAGKTFTGTLGASDHRDIERTLKNSNMPRFATLVQADKPVSLLQIADQDGLNATPHLPTSMLSSVYGIPYNADYVGIIAKVATDVEVYNPNGVLINTVSLAHDNGADPLAPYALKYRGGGDIPAGTTFTCSSPCFMIYDDKSAGNNKDETLMMGFSP